MKITVGFLNTLDYIKLGLAHVWISLEKHGSGLVRFGPDLVLSLVWPTNLSRTCNGIKQ